MHKPHKAASSGFDGGLKASRTAFSLFILRLLVLQIELASTVQAGYKWGQPYLMEIPCPCRAN